MADQLTIIKGDTFNAEGVYQLADGTPVDLNSAGITIESYARGKNGDKYPLIVTFLPTVGHYSVSGSTENWPLGRLTWHVRYTQGTIIRSIDPVTVDVEAS